MPIFSFQAACQKLAGGSFPHFFLLTGEERYLAREFVHHLRERLEKDGELADYLELDQETAGAEFFDTLATLPLTGTKRFLVVENLPLSFLVPYLKMEDPPCYLVVLQPKQGKQQGKDQQAYQLFERKGWIVNCSPLKGKELISWVQGKARWLGKELPVSAAEYLRFLCGNDLAQMCQEIEKASLFLGSEGKVISLDVLQKIGSRSVGGSVFELVDAVVEGKREDVGEILEELWAQGVYPVLLVSLLSRHFIQLLEVVSLLEEGARPGDISRMIKLHPYAVRKLLKQGTSFSAGKIEQILGILLELDYSIKKGEGNPRVLLEATTSEIMEKIEKGRH